MNGYENMAGKEMTIMSKLEETVRPAQGTLAYGSDDSIIRLCMLVLVLFPLAILAGLAVAIIVGGR
jgi:hypothetical protein